MPAVFDESNLTSNIAFMGTAGIKVTVDEPTETDPSINENLPLRRSKSKIPVLTSTDSKATAACNVKSKTSSHNTTTQDHGTTRTSARRDNRLRKSISLTENRTSTSGNFPDHYARSGVAVAVSRKVARTSSSQIPTPTTKRQTCSVSTSATTVVHAGTPQIGHRSKAPRVR